MKIEVLLKKSSEWLAGKGPESDLVISSRIRLARNLNNLPFPWRSSNEDRQYAIDTINDAIKSCSVLEKGSLFINMSDLDEIDRLFLVERHLISPELATAPEGASVIISKKEVISIMINEEDHLRIQVMHSGLQLNEVWELIDNLDTELAKKLDIAFSPKLGFLTVCPTNLGTGMRASTMLHIPALVYTKKINDVLQATSKLGLTVRGLYGEGSEALGNLFQISNQATLGLSEQEIIDNLSVVVKKIITYERNQRRYLINKSLKEVEDKIWRAFGLLTNARIISSKETISHLSTLRMGIDLGILDHSFKKKISRLIITTQPAHLQKNIGRMLSTQERDIARASLIRDTLSEADPGN